MLNSFSFRMPSFGEKTNDTCLENASNLTMSLMTILKLSKKLCQI